MVGEPDQRKPHKQIIFRLPTNMGWKCQMEEKPKERLDRRMRKPNWTRSGIRWRIHLKLKKQLSFYIRFTQSHLTRKYLLWSLQSIFTHASKFSFFSPSASFLCFALQISALIDKRKTGGGGDGGGKKARYDDWAAFLSLVLYVTISWIALPFWIKKSISQNLLLGEDWE